MHNILSENALEFTKMSVNLTIARILRMILCFYDLNEILGGKYIKRYWTDPFKDKTAMTLWNSLQLNEKNPVNSHLTLYHSDILVNELIAHLAHGDESEDNLESGCGFNMKFEQNQEAPQMINEKIFKTKSDKEVASTTDSDVFREFERYKFVQKKIKSETFRWQKIRFIARLRSIMRYLECISTNFVSKPNFFLRSPSPFSKQKKFASRSSSQIESLLKDSNHSQEQQKFHINEEFPDLVKNIKNITKIVDYFELWFVHMGTGLKFYPIDSFFDEWDKECQFKRMRGSLFRCCSQ